MHIECVCVCVFLFLLNLILIIGKNKRITKPNQKQLKLYQIEQHRLCMRCKQAIMTFKRQVSIWPP